MIAKHRTKCPCRNTENIKPSYDNRGQKVKTNFTFFYFPFTFWAMCSIFCFIVYISLHESLVGCFTMILRNHLCKLNVYIQSYGKSKSQKILKTANEFSPTKLFVFVTDQIYVTVSCEMTNGHKYIKKS